jgi:hypothetical protein
MGKGITRKEILEKLPNLKPGNFDFFCARAGIKHNGVRPSGTKRPHIMEYTYPSDSVKRLESVMQK